MEKSIGFIGGGRITNIILRALKNKNRELSSVFVNETDQNVLKNLKNNFPEINECDLAEAAKKEIVFIALHPPVIKEILEHMADAVTDNSVIISLAPKISADILSQKLGNKNIIRMIPNATSVINEGINPVYISDQCHSSSEILDLLSDLGHTFETEESKLEAYAIVSAMLPTYFWFQWTEMIDIGVQIGLSQEESREAVQKTLHASLNTLFDSSLSNDEVIDLIPVKPIGEHETEIQEIYRNKLLGLFNKIKP